MHRKHPILWVTTRLQPLSLPTKPCVPLERVFRFRSARVCDSGLKGRFPKAQGAALGLGHPQKRGFPGLKGRFQGSLGFSVMHGVPGAYAPGSAETGPSGLSGCLGVSRPGAYAPGFAEVGPSGLVRASAFCCGFRSVVCASGPCFVGSACPRLRFRPEGSVSEIRGHKQLNFWVMTRLQPVSSTAFKPPQPGKPLAEAHRSEVVRPYLNHTRPERHQQNTSTLLPALSFRRQCHLQVRTCFRVDPKKSAAIEMAAVQRLRVVSNDHSFNRRKCWNFPAHRIHWCGGRWQVSGRYRHRLVCRNRLWSRDRSGRTIGCRRYRGRWWRILGRHRSRMILRLHHGTGSGRRTTGHRRSKAGRSCQGTTAVRPGANHHMRSMTVR